MTKEELRERLLKSRSESKQYMDEIIGSDNLSKELVRRNIRRFVLSRFMLPLDCTVQDFDELAILSIAESTRISPELVRELEETQDCAGSTSSTAKKVLLFLSIQKSLGIELPAMETAYITSTDSLADLVYAQLMK